MQVLPQFHQFVSLTTETNQSNQTLGTLIQDLTINEQTRALVLTILIAICLSIIILLTILGNILVLIALCIDFALRSPTHLLMGNLACADLLLGMKQTELILCHVRSSIRYVCAARVNISKCLINQKYQIFHWNSPNDNYFRVLIFHSSVVKGCSHFKFSNTLQYDLQLFFPIYLFNVAQK
jgi:hypothetical protein